MAPLTWQQVAGADFRGTNQALALGNEALNRAFTGISDALGKFDTYSKDVRLSNILNQTTGLTDPTQLRAAIAGADRSGLGAAQFAALENMLSGRIGQARDQEALSQALKINPLLLTEQVIKNDTGQEKLIDLRLRNPLERNEIVARTGLLGAQAGAASANAASTRQQTDERSKGAPYRLSILGDQATTSRSTVDEAAENREADQIAAQINRDVTNRFDAEGTIAGMNLSPSIRAKVQARAAQHWGAFTNTPDGSSPANPAATGAVAAPGGASGRGALQQAAPAGPIPYIAGQEQVTTDAVAADRAAASLAARVAANESQREATTGVGAISRSMQDNTTPDVVAAELKKAGSFANVPLELLDTRIREIMQIASNNKVPITARAAAHLFATDADFSNYLLRDAGIAGFGSVAGNNPSFNTSIIIDKIKNIGSDSFKNQVIASAQVTGGLNRVQAAQSEFDRATRAFQQEYVAAQNRGQQTSKGLERTKKQLEEARGRFDRAYRKFLEDNPDYARSTAQRTQPGTTMALVDGGSVLSSQPPPPPPPRRTQGPSAARIGTAVPQAPLEAQVPGSAGAVLGRSQFFQRGPRDVAPPASPASPKTMENAITELRNRVRGGNPSPADVMAVALKHGVDPALLQRQYGSAR